MSLVTLAVGCGNTPEPQPTTPGQPRIVSLSPAVSRTLLDFGLQQQIVGRSRWCASLDPAIPVLGDLYEINYEWLLRLHPTHVLVQPAASTGLDPTLERLAAEHDWVVGHWRINTIADIEQMVRDLPAVLFPQGDPCRETAAARAADLLNRIDVALTPRRADLWSGRTLLVADVDPDIERPEVHVWVPGEAEAVNIKKSGQGLVRGGEIHMLQCEDVSNVFCLSIEILSRCHHLSPVVEF